MLIKFLTIFLPWPLKRFVLERWFNFEIHPEAKIGLSWVYPGKLIMQANSKIDHFTIAINLDYIKMGINATIGRGNWITGLSSNRGSLHFQHQKNRRSDLNMGECSAIT